MGDVPVPFRAWGASHVASLCALATLAVALVAMGRRSSGAASRLLSRGLAVVILCVMVPFQIYSMIPPNWSLAFSLPFELCDLAWMAAAAALWTEKRVWVALTYYWGLTLTSQALFTPRLELDFPHAQFCMFWLQHGLIVAAAIFLTWGLRLRPTWAGYRAAVAVTLGWAALMLGFNAVAGTNYGFLCEKPARSILDHLGPWPWYVAAEVAILAALWALITWPWTGGRGKNEPHDPASPSASEAPHSPRSPAYNPR